MVIDYCFHAFGSTIADSDAASVKYLAEAVIFANFCGCISTERGLNQIILLSWLRLL